MKLGLDRYAKINSPIHRWEQRSKLVALVSLIFAIAFVNQLILLPAVIGVTMVLYGLSKLPLSFLLTRMRYPGLFILAVVLLVLFASSGGAVLFSLGPLAVTQEGVESVLLIATRFLCILTVSLILFGTAPFLTTIKAMRSLHLPDVIVDMMLLSYRYLEEFGETRMRMQRAMRMRGFESDRFSVRNLNLWAGLAGSLLIRSYDRSERVYQAMRLRGYGSRKSSIGSNRQEFAADISEANKTSKIAFWLTLFVATVLVAAEIFF
ncbi:MULTISPECIES: cobalt ECF transporter T component CbiQ [unclassified Coleofasciculus]|uniref:cobalt ECF transporter T component CbiQ n=1 Tax=unclassified Coleofasciculus TaxID=2692782 RepID=UPI001880ADC3|nr:MULTISPECIES: cobalt ECF transporter T component CbiQ [unclassified Coleofasciculus]MBE9128909.1 cobalt ECF transporter T component CbiQ [Coleofasciculus sp. LEGE 07081]MBE9151647.1 cobalt ECF transporter T component CbiQ [Coleofasciculus sp. LEGE 07092]